MKIEHIALYVRDLENARDFFEKYLGGHSNGGYHNKKTDFRSYFITFDDGARLEIMTRPEVCGDCEEGENQYKLGYVHLAFSVGSEQAVRELTKRFREDGYDVISGPRTTGDGYYESCIVGIEGNQIEITV